MDTKSINNNSLIQSLTADKADRANKAKNRSEADPSVNSGDANLQAFTSALSPKAKEMAIARKKAMDIARNTPDVRESRVAELKQQIQEGRYKVNPEGIADGILREAARDEIALGMHEEAKKRE